MNFIKLIFLVFLFSTNYSSILIGKTFNTINNFNKKEVRNFKLFKIQINSNKLFNFDKEWLERQIKLIKMGDRKVISNIRFFDYEKMILLISKKAEKLGEPVINFLAKTVSSKFKLINSFIGGLKNFDPRIRLSSSIILKNIFKKLKVIFSLKEDEIKKKKLINLTKKEKMIFTKKNNYIKTYYKMINLIKNQIHKFLFKETVNNKKYISRKFYNKIIFDNTYNKINELYLYLIREITLNKLNNFILKPKNFEFINFEIYKSITESIGKESKNNIPIFKLKNNLDILLFSLKNKDYKIQNSALNFLIQINNSNNINIKSQLEKKLINFPYLRFKFKIN